MFTTLYRLEMSPQQQQAFQQQQQVQQGTQQSNLPMEKPDVPTFPSESEEASGSGEFASTYQQDRPAEDIGKRMNISRENMLKDVQGNRFTKFEMDRVGGIAERLRGMIDSGGMTESEAQQVLIKALKEDSKNMSKWMRGGSETPWYDRPDAEMIMDYVDKNQQAFDEFNKLQAEVELSKERLDHVYDKKSPKYAKAMQALAQKSQRVQQLEQTLQQGLYGDEMVQAGVEMNQARSESA